MVDGVSYEYREGEPLDSSTDSFDFIEAIIALACSGNDISLVATAKGYVGGLYSDISTAPYKSLFNSSTNSSRLWSIVQLGRRIEAAVRAKYDKSSTTQKGLVVHGNRFLAHAIFSELAKKHELARSQDIPEDHIKKVASSLLKKIESVLTSEYPDSYLAPLFKNVSKCVNIKSKL